MKIMLTILYITTIWLISPLWSGPLQDNTMDTLLLYHLDAGEGTHVADSSEKGIPCTLGGTTSPVWVTGLFRNGLYFSGGTCATGTDARLAVSNFTIAAWVKPDKTLAAAGDRGMSVAAQWAVGYGSFYSLRIQNGFISSDVVGDSPQGCIGTVRVSTGAWTHIAVARRALGVRRRDLYVNGVLDTTCPSGTGNVGGAGPPFSLGNDPNGPNMDYFGLMDDVILLKRAASSGEIASWYSQGLGRHAQ